MKLPEELQFMQNSLLPQKRTSARMEGKVCVVSGATSGVGYQAAKALAKGGAHIVMVCRNAEKARKVQEELGSLYGTKTDFFIADFKQLAQISQAAKEIARKYPKVHILINNAGVFNKR